MNELPSLCNNTKRLCIRFIEACIMLCFVFICLIEAMVLTCIRVQEVELLLLIMLPEVERFPLSVLLMEQLLMDMGVL